MKKEQRQLSVAFIVMLAGSPGCSGVQTSHVSSIALPGNPVISFPNSPDRVNTTLILSKPAGQVAGVDGRMFTISNVTFNQPQDLLTLDASGNLGLHGSFHSLSSRLAKKDIKPFGADALALLAKTNIVTFRYRGEPESMSPHVGLVAEDAPLPLTDEGHHSFDLNNSIAVTIAATHQLDGRIRHLESEIDMLESELREIRRDRRK